MVEGTVLGDVRSISIEKKQEVVEILDDEIQSRYEKIHRKNGLCFALVEIFNVIGMNDTIWRIEKLDR